MRQPGRHFPASLQQFNRCSKERLFLGFQCRTQWCTNKKHMVHWRDPSSDVRRIQGNARRDVACTCTHKTPSRINYQKVHSATNRDRRIVACIAYNSPRLFPFTRQISRSLH